MSSSADEARRQLLATAWMAGALALAGARFCAGAAGVRGAVRGDVREADFDSGSVG
jgi:hypothetical protein